MAGSPRKRARKERAAAARGEATTPPRGEARGLAAKLRSDVKANKEDPSFKAWESRLTPVETIVETICEFMMNGQWLGGASILEVARKFELSPESVRRYAAEANRLLRSRLRDDPELHDGARMELLQNFRVIRAIAMQQKDAAGLGVALNANRALGFYLGIEPAKRIDVNDVTDDDQDGWTDAELEAFVKTGARPRRALRAVAHALTSGETDLSNGRGNGHANGNGHDAEFDDDDFDGGPH